MSSKAEASTIRKPLNFVVITVDDLGWADPGCYGNTFIDTPNLDRLSAQGLRFSQGYSASPICSPSRASQLTGRSPARLHFEFVTKEDDAPHPNDTKLIQPPWPRDLPLEEVMIGEIMGRAGYATGFVGKWHLTQNNDRYLGYGPTHGPANHGFAFTAEDRGAHPYTYEERTFEDFQAGEYVADATTKNAIRFLKKNRERPFLLWYASYFPHRPVHTRLKWLYEKYCSRAPEGKTGDQIMFGAFVETMDHYIGELLEAIDDLGLAESTVVMFTSDHGGDPRDSTGELLRGSKWTLYEGGVRVPFLVRWPGVVPTGTVSEVPVMGTDILPTVCELAGLQPHPAIPLDGISFAQVLRGNEEVHRQKRDTLFWHFPFYHPPFGYEGTSPCSAIRKGNDKLIHFYEDDHLELFDLEEDVEEQFDLAKAEPAKAGELREELSEHLRSVEARMPAKR